MQSKTSTKQKISDITLAVLVLFAVLLFYFIDKSFIQTSSKSSTGNVSVLQNQEQVRHGLPTRLKIPVININAGIEYVGLTSDGAMDVPKNPNNVAWYSPGSHPGENGSAVIAGHLDDKNGKPAVFYYLNKLKVGDKIYVQDDKDTTIIFVVRESRSYDPKADATDVFTSNDGKSHLNLITCEGSWNHSANSYSKRLVVFTDGESDRR